MEGSLYYGGQAQIEKSFKSYRNNKKKANAVNEKKFKKLVEQKRNKTEKKLQHFHEMQLWDDENKKGVYSKAISLESGKI